MANANPFYNNMYGVLYQEASNRGLPNPEAIAHLGATQAANESAYGRSAPGNNYFGIKGPGQKLKTSEFINGEMVSTKDSFRQYNSMQDSASGYLDFLSNNGRYKDVLNARTPEEAIALQGRTGYATDPNYGSKLASIYRNNGNIMPPQNGMLSQARPDQESQYTPNPILRQNPNAGILERIANSPGLSEGLIQMGAGLLSQTGTSNPLANGLSKGFTGFNAGYDQGIENAKARAVPIAGGAFTQITDAQGNVTVVPNKDAQDFLLKQVGVKSDAAMRVKQYDFDNRPLTAPEQRELKELDQGITDAGSKLSSIERTRTALNDPKLNDWTRIAASGLPFGKAVSEALGMPEADVNRMVEDLKVDSWLVRSAALKGAISDAENERLSRPMPSSFASKEKLLNWLDERERDMKKMQSGLQALRETDYRKGGKPAAPKDNADSSNTGLGTGKSNSEVKTEAIPPIGQNQDDPLGLNLKKR